MSYQAIVCRISGVYEIPGADFIQRAVVMGTSVVVSKSIKEGDVGVFFPCDGQLLPEFLKANDLVGVYLNGKKISGGFFTQSGRVKAQKFKQIKSEGFWCELSLFNFIENKTGKKIEWKEGDKFDELQGIKICQKYFTPKTLNERNKLINKVRRTLRVIGFKEHLETEQLRFNLRNIPSDSLVVLTWKLHGTSGRSSLALIEQDLPWYKKIINKVHRFWPDRFYKELIGTRRTVVNDEGFDGFYKEQFRKLVHDKYFKGKMHKGESWYYEIVGYCESGRPIMNTQENEKLKEKSIVRLYGSVMEYAYGCPKGESDVYVYRIVRTNEDGVETELSWNHVKARCKEIGVKHVPEVEKPFHFDGSGTDLLNKCDALLDRPSVIDSRHIEEGVALRIESSEKTGIDIFKHKSFYFLCLEGVAKEDDSYVDTEEIS